jgi:CrcB protein
MRTGLLCPKTISCMHKGVELPKPAELVFVCLGGALGAVGRFVLAHVLQGRLHWFTGTLLVNWLGCLLMGVLATWLAGRAEAVWLKPLLLAGLLGGFTTFSAFALEAQQFWDVHPVQAAAYIMLSVGGGLVLFRLGAGAVA